MKKISVLLSLMAISFASVAQSPKEKLLLVCGDSKVLLVDYQNGKDTIPAVVWTWDAHEAMDLPAEFRTRKFNTMDDCKAIQNGEQILVSSSSGAIAIINRKDKKVLFHASVPNAHSIELLPNDLIAAAASTNPTGNRIMLFDRKQPDKPLFSDSLYSAHGVVWDQKRQSLYALGMTALREYKLVRTGSPSLKLVQEWKIPGNSGHDLQPTLDGNFLYLTETGGAWQFDLKKHTFTKIPGFTDAPHTKSVGRDRSGQFIYTVPEESWWTFHVRFQHPTHALSFPNMKVYKARWFQP
ncbi:hypothetical protein LX87_01851 [Larkinella arboricola]|uniref:WD40 repeat protein n=1 Tax=Larkinella arboricola TaxID=643671 RepID=A0A327X4Z4_LARAB|nr:DUF6528 family protein [Larkinella arboricola]RAK00153.1 hypothetical protein LX87_01851 [Larkinella arboricola]